MHLDSGVKSAQSEVLRDAPLARLMPGPNQGRRGMEQRGLSAQGRRGGEVRLCQGLPSTKCLSQHKLFRCLRSEAPARKTASASAIRKV